MSENKTIFHGNDFIRGHKCSSVVSLSAGGFGGFHRNSNCRFDPRSVRAAASSRINPSASS
jgi:hypothetical protein